LGSLLLDSVGLHLLLNDFLGLDGLLLLHLGLSELLSVFLFLRFLNSFSFHCDSLLFSLSDLGLFVFNGSLVFFDDLFILDFGVRVEFSGIFD
jgi:hypothetical protein